jgi:hypothetical protein
MKIIPYLRFAWAISIIIQVVSETSLFNANQPQDALPFDLIIKLILVTFSLYCVIMGVQEVVNKQFVEAPYFYIFGIFFQTLISLALLYILNVVRGLQIDMWRVGLLMIWEMVLFMLIFVDIKRLYTN